MSRPALDFNFAQRRRIAAGGAPHGPAALAQRREELSRLMPHRLHSIACIVALTGLAGAAASADTRAAQPDARSTPSASESAWPMFRGGLLLNGVAVSTLPDKPEVIWRFTVKDQEPFTSSAAIVGGRVFVGCDDGFLRCLDLADGRVRWEFKAGDQAAVQSSPAVHDGVVYFGDEAGVFRAVAADTGKEKWSYKATTEIISSATVARDRLVFGCYDGGIYCLKLVDGSLLWKVSTDAQVHGTVGVAGEVALSAGCDGQLRVIALDDGKVIRAIDASAQSAASAAILGDRVFIGTMGNRVLGIDWRQGTVEWAYENPDRSFPFQSSAAVTDKAVVIGGRDKLIHALDPKTGKALWTHATGARADSSPVIVGDRVFCGSGDGNLYALDLATGRETWRFEAGAPILASPAVAAGRLVIGTADGVLYCFGPKSAPVSARSGPVKAD